MKPKTNFEIPREEDLNTQAFLLESRWFEGVGHDHGVVYAHGTGVLSALTLAEHRSHWLFYDKEKGWQKAKVKEKNKFFLPILEFYMKHRKASISLIDVEEAGKILDRIRKNPKSFLPQPEKPKEEKEEKPEEKKPGEEPLPHEVKEKEEKKAKKDKK